MVFRRSWRRSIKISLFVEGPSDEVTLRVLIRRILGRQVPVIPRVKRRGDLLKKEKIYSHITKDILPKYPDISKIIICVDSECTPETEAKANIRKLEDSFKSKVNCPLYCITVIHALEGWLLADPDTIREYLGSRARVDISPSKALSCKPKEVMKRVFRQNGREFLSKRDSPRIAERVDIDKIVKNNKSFECFRDRVKDP